MRALSQLCILWARTIPWKNLVDILSERPYVTQREMAALSKDGEAKIRVIKLICEIINAIIICPKLRPNPTSRDSRLDYLIWLAIIWGAAASFCIFPDGKCKRGLGRFGKYHYLIGKIACAIFALLWVLWGGSGEPAIVLPHNRGGRLSKRVKSLLARSLANGLKRLPIRTDCWITISPCGS